jgi:hypothetical protein
MKFLKLIVVISVMDGIISGSILVDESFPCG